MKNHRFVSRRSFLRGAGVAVALPWMESLLPREAWAQAAGPRRRFLPIFLPNGASENWAPIGFGQGDAWKLSSVLSPLAPFKAKVTMLSNLENGSSFNANGGSSVEPSHGRQPGAWLTCIDPGVVRMQMGVSEANRISMDQTMAKDPNVAPTPIKSLQVGLSTWLSNCDGQPCSNSRTISWNDQGRPMYKSVDPLEIFTKMTAAGAGAMMPPGTVMPDPNLTKRIALNKSVLDAVKDNATRTQLRLGRADKAQFEQFLTHVRAVEKVATTTSQGMGGLACTPIARPMEVKPFTPTSMNGIKSNGASYNKNNHANVMNDLIAMAFQCDATRVITYMLEDERSEFVYGHVTRHTFPADGGAPAMRGGTCGEYHNNGQHGDQQDFASITWWNTTKVAELCMKLDAIKEGERSVLDNTVIFYGGAMHGSNHACNRLPIAVIGGGGGKLKGNQHINTNNRWLRDLHITLMKNVFGMSGAGVDDFGITRAGNPAMPITEILL
jgi:hypothetical protein